MFTIVAARGSQFVDFEFDRAEDDFEVLHFQILSLFDELDEDFTLIDFAGRELNTLQDLDELHVTTSIHTAAAATPCVHMSVMSTEGANDDADNIRLYVWVVDIFNSYNELFTTTCSSITFSNGKDENDIIQPRSRIIDTPFDLCLCCKRHISPGLLQESSNNTMISLQPFRCKGKEAFEFGLTLDSYHQQFVMSTGEVRSDKQVSPESPIGKYLRRHYLQLAVESQALYAQGGGGGGRGGGGSGGMAMSEGERQLEGRLRSGVKTVQVESSCTLAVVQCDAPPSLLDICIYASRGAKHPSSYHMFSATPTVPWCSYTTHCRYACINTVHHSYHACELTPCMLSLSSA